MDPDQHRATRSIAGLKSSFRTVMLVCLVAALCYLTAKLAGVLALRPAMIWPLWPGCAVLVAVLLLVPRRTWPLLIPAGLAGFVLYDLQIGLTIGSIALLTLANTIEVLVAALGLSYFFDGAPRLDSVRALAKYSLLAVILAPVSAAFVGATALPGRYWISWRISFFTEALALLTVTPAILNGFGRVPSWTRKSPAYYFEAAVLMAGLLLSAYIIFVASGSRYEPVGLYLLVPFLLWSALRFGSTGISFSMMAVVFLSIGGAVKGRGPFVGSEPLNNILHMQVFLFVAAAPFMVLAAVMEDYKGAAAVLRESEQRFRLVANTAPVLIWMSGPDKRCTYCNQSWLDFTGWRLEAKLGSRWAECVHPDDFERYLETYTQAFDRRKSYRMEYRLAGHDGKFRWVFDIGVPRVNSDGSFAGYINSCVDLTERKRAEQDLREGEQLKASILDSLSNYIVVVNPEGMVVAVNDPKFHFVASDSLLGLGVGANYFEMCEGRIKESNPGETKALDGIHAVFDGKLDYFESEYASHSTTEQLWLLMSVTPLKGPDRGIVISHQDITERKRHEQAIRELSGRLINAQEQERSRIARELHDNINQQLALLAIEIQQLESFLPDSSEGRQKVQALWKQTHELSTEIQHISHQLHSTKLEHLGIVAALRGLCREFSAQYKIDAACQIRQLPLAPDSDASLAIFRVAQESLHNVAKHSRAKQVRIELVGTDGKLVLRVSDDGVGFDPDKPVHKTGLGMISMGERVHSLGGTISVWSRLSMGTQVEATIPLSRGTVAVNRTSESESVSSGSKTGYVPGL